MKMNAGAWIGIIGGIAGAVIGIVTVILTAGTIGLYIAGGIIVLFGGMGFLFYKLFFQQMIMASRLRKTGIAGKGVITDIVDTGVAINYQPQVKLILDVKNSVGQTYTGSVKIVLSRFQMQQYQPGMTVALLIDPNDEKKMILDASKPVQTVRSTQPNVNVDELKAELKKLQVEMEELKRK